MHDVKAQVTDRLLKINDATQAATLWLERANETVLMRDDLDPVADAVAAFAQAAQASIQLAQFHRDELRHMESQMGDAKLWEKLGNLL